MLTDKQTRLKQCRRKSKRNNKTFETIKSIATYKGRREVSAGKFIKEMSFIKRNGVNWYKFKVHEPR